MGEVREFGRKRQAARAGRGKDDEESLREEIATLRGALRQAKEAMEQGEEEASRVGGVVARLSDSIGRALLAQRKLRSGAEGAARLQEETDRLLRELGLGER